MNSLKTIVDFCRRKGFVYPSSEIYGGFAATYDFGPLGHLLKKNIEQTWRNWMVNYRTDVVEIEGAIFLHPRVWEASGHVAGFADLLVEDLVNKKRHRADHLVEEAEVFSLKQIQTKEDFFQLLVFWQLGKLGKVEQKSLQAHFQNLKSLFIELLKVENLNAEWSDFVRQELELLFQKLESQKIITKTDHGYQLLQPLVSEYSILSNAGACSPEEIDQLVVYYNLKSPEGNPLGKAKRFNLLVKTYLGPVEDDNSLAYLKGESCQNIYVDYKQVQETTRNKIPFGIAQQGKTFRNEITPRQFLFRTREFEQNDLQFFCEPPEIVEEKKQKFPDREIKSPEEWYTYWKEYTFQFYTQGLGLSAQNLRWRQHAEDERAFYALDAWDLEYNFGEMGWKEIGGLHHRGSYDLDQHSKFSGQDLSYFDPELQKRYNPFIIEVSLGLNRMFLAVLFEHYTEEVIDSDTQKTQD